MSVPSKKVWMNLFSAAGLPSESIAKYADIFADERLRLEMITELPRSEFEELGITALGDQLAIKKQAEKMLQEQRQSRIEDSDSDEVNRQRKQTPQKQKTRSKPSAMSRLAPAKRADYSDKESMGDESDRESEDDDGDDVMDIDAQVKLPPQRNVDRSAVHRLRVVRKGEESESKRALRMLTVANSAIGSQHRETDDDFASRAIGSNSSKMRSDMIASSSSNRDKHLPPPDPVNNLSRLASPANKQPILEPVLIRNLKTSLKTTGGALKRLGPRKGGIRPVETNTFKQNALARLDKGGAGSRFTTEQRGNVLVRTIQGLAVESPRRKAASSRGSALQRLGGRSADKTAVGSEPPHPLSRC